MIYHDLEKTYLILDLLKKYKIVTRDKLAKDAGTNIAYVTNSINYLRTKGYIINTNLGPEGYYEYKGKQKVSTDKKLDRIQVKGIKKLYKRGIKIDKIENIVNTTRGSVFYHLHKQNVKPNRRKLEINEERRKKVIEMYNQGLSIKEIGDNLGITEKHTCCVLYRCVKGNRRKVIDNKQELIEYIKNSNETGKEIAKKFNVSEGTISNLKKKIKG